MKNIVMATLLAALSLPALCAGPRLDVPAQLSESVLEQAPGVGVAVGLYATTERTVSVDMLKLQEDDSALDDMLTALIVDVEEGQFHFSSNGLGISLEEKSLSFQRAGQNLNLENACVQWPVRGDKLLGVYEQAGWQATLEVRVESHVPYIRRNGKLTPSAPGATTTCAGEVGAQTYYQGKLTVFFDGKVLRSTPVIAYNLQLP